MNRKLLPIIIILLILVIEILFRIIGYEQLKSRKFPDIYIQDLATDYLYVSNKEARIIYPSQDNTFKLNNHGFIGKDFSLNKQLFSITKSLLITNRLQ